MSPYLLGQLGFPGTRGWSRSRRWGEEKRGSQPRQWKSCSAAEEGLCCSAATPWGRRSDSWQLAPSPSAFLCPASCSLPEP